MVIPFFAVGWAGLVVTEIYIGATEKISAIIPIYRLFGKKRQLSQTVFLSFIVESLE
ncbi:hypothetical protein [Bacillus cereus group sp. BfR-BA-01309]|uniref:hypothetical protein n=1 Tax=Bacillus cereus group sp. BfR-BA-01309 TaxID=2920286 RepID=UPI001F58A9BC|nr:hypothetical protein [Bacillus cereus group sp. BfR-BA-01309]